MDFVVACLLQIAEFHFAQSFQPHLLLSQLLLVFLTKTLQFSVQSIALFAKLLAEKLVFLRRIPNLVVEPFDVNRSIVEFFSQFFESKLMSSLYRVLVDAMFPQRLI